MDQEHGLFRLPGHDAAPGECRSCAIARCTEGQNSTHVGVDADAVVISRPELNGLIVVPRQHIGGLEELPIPRRASVLATLRRATRSVSDRNRGSTSRVIALTDQPGSRGHVCFQVLPTVTHDPVGSAS